MLHTTVCDIHIALRLACLWLAFNNGNGNTIYILLVTAFCKCQTVYTKTLFIVQFIGLLMTTVGYLSIHTITFILVNL